MLFKDIINDKFDRFKFVFVRVYLDKYDNVNDKILVSDKIIQYLWWDKVLWYIILWDWSKKISNKIINRLKKLKIYNILSGCYILSETNYDEKSIWYLHGYVLCLDSNLRKHLLKIVIENELWIRDYLNIEVYYYIISKWILIYPYDDRWMDIIILDNNKKKLKEIYYEIKMLGYHCEIFNLE